MTCLADRYGLKQDDKDKRAQQNAMPAVDSEYIRKFTSSNQTSAAPHSKRCGDQGQEEKEQGGFWNGRACTKAARIFHGVCFG
jgi:hypothetical protein